jgi:two-component system chemotaxis response regulator CheB
MRGHDIVVVGASAGGVEALGRLARGLPEDLPAALFVVLHMPPSTSSALPSILDRQGPPPTPPASAGTASPPTASTSRPARPSRRPRC